MEKTNRGHQRFFSTLAFLIRTTDFILAGGGYFKNMVWIFLAMIAAWLIAHDRHVTALGCFFFIVGVVITRFIVEVTLVRLSIWVSRNLLAIENQGFTDTTTGFQQYEKRHGEIVKESKK